MKKITIIGPVYPYKGGIAHYSSLLYKALSKSYEMSMISFKRQYPKFLYPGKEQKDFENDHFKIPDTKYLIDAVNPFNWFHAFLKIKKSKPDVVIFQWWNPFFSFSFSFISYLLKWFTAAKIIFLCHNVLPHEKLPLGELLTRITLYSGDYFIVQSMEDEKKLLDIRPGCRYKRTYHPTYNVFKYDDITREEACKKLNINPEEKILLFFGFVREYKGLMYLINALPEIKKAIPNIKLLIVGDFYDGSEKYLKRINELGIDGNIHIYDGYIPDKEVGKFFSACDLVVLPYISATQSGIVQIAYGFNKSVVVTDVGGLPEVVDDKETGYVVKSGDTQGIVNAVLDFYNNKRQAFFTNNIIKSQDKYSWDRMVETIEKLGEL